MPVTPASIQARVAKGQFKPHSMLTNMATAYFQDASKSFARSIFPTCPVVQSADNYYVFDKEDLLRDNWQGKPAYGKVDPAVVSEHTENYAVVVDQMIMGIDSIRQTDLERRQGPSIADPRIQRTRVMAQQNNIHQDRLFADKYFNSSAWGNTKTGTDTNPGTNQFIKFSNNNSDPIKYVDDLATEMESKTGFRPNRMAIGANVFKALKVHPGIVERVKYSGSTANPATVTENVLAQLFDMERIVQLRSIMNNAERGATDNIGFIGDPNGILLAYATDAPSVDIPSAGYIFTWDMLGDGNYMPILNYEGENGTHSEYVEGLMATDMHKTCDDLAVFLAEAV